MDGAKLGVPDTTYLCARVRSARDHGLGDELDLHSGVGKIVSLAEKQLTLDEAWPNLPFEKVDKDRASLVVGAFIQGSLFCDPASVAARIQQADTYRSLVDYVVERAGEGYVVASPDDVAVWLSDLGKPGLDALIKAVEQHALVGKAQQTFAAEIEGQLEIVGAHAAQLKAIFLKHQHAKAAGEQTDPPAAGE